MTAADDIGVGVIGAGAMARAYCECLRRHTHGGRLVGITGGKRAAALAKDYDAIAEPNVEALFGRNDVDAVIIATPEMHHAEQTLLAAAASKHVLVEKPMAPDTRACDAMIAACAATRVKLMVVKHWRFRGVHTRAIDLLNAGTLGKILRIENRTRVPLVSSLATVAQKPFYLDPAGGGLLMGWAVHNLDWVCALAKAAPQSVSAEVMKGHETLGDTRLAAELEFAGGGHAWVCVEIDLPAPPGPGETFRTEIKTDRGRLDLDGYGALRVQRDGGDWETVWTQPAFDPRDATDPLRLAAYAAMLQAFIDCVRNDTEPPVSGYDGRLAVELFGAATRGQHGLRRVTGLRPQT